jgi:tRNA(Ile)-lysidine synthase
VKGPDSLRLAVRRALDGLSEAPGVVAVSGGPDSVALLRALALGVAGPLVVAHLNHQLRGEESTADEEFVRQLHADLGAAGANLGPLQATRVDVRAAAVGDNVEATGRRLRYDWLTQVARDTGSAWVATGHTADDQAETVLHRLLRGAGLRGLIGVVARRPLAPGILLVRPLLRVRRAEVLAFLEALGQPFRQDSSNRDRHYTRSRLRHDLLPVLARDYNPGVVAALGRLAEQAAEAQTFIEEQAARVLAAAELPRAGATLVLEARRLTAEPALLQREAVRLLWRREGWPDGEMGFDDWARVMEVIRGDRPALDAPGGVRVSRVGQVVRFARPQANCSGVVGQLPV